MAVDFTLILDDQPGELARLGEILGEAGVNIGGLAAFTGDGRGVIHVLVADEAKARATAALKAGKMGVADAREVLVVDVDDRPGSLGQLTRQLAEANVNIDLAYTAFGGGVKLLLGAHDLLYDGNSQKGTEFASRMQDGEPIGQSWLEAVWYADNSNHPSAAATGYNADDCWNRLGMNLQSVQTSPALRDGDIGYYCWVGWNGS